MSKRYWKSRIPSSLKQALEWNKNYAKDVHNLSVERIAERMGLPDHSILYKWLANGRMPAVLIPSYEFACEIDFPSRWLAATHGRLVVRIPSGKKSGAKEVMELQGLCTKAVSVLIDFYQGGQDKDQALTQLQAAMEGLAFHHHNIQHYETPELPLGEGDDE